ncbi:MAG TPA: hypothetical protein VG328_10340 [Stellaceae bacterium]|jgi:hypothetical protein|nr:hypothetical protein [Stellaceae bacterium]
MALYRCYFRGVTGRFESRQDFAAASDDEAIATARRLYADKGLTAGFELWNGVHLVFAEPAAGK